MRHLRLVFAALMFLVITTSMVIAHYRGRVVTNPTQILLTHTTVRTGDSSQIWAFTPTTAVDDYQYGDTIVINDGADSIEVLWTAPAAATDVAMVCDSMAAYINAAACSSFVTAADSTTAYYIHSDSLGWAFDVYLADTATDSVHTVANVTSWSSVKDTFPLFSLTHPTKYCNLYGQVILPASHVTAQGYGLSDSGWIWLYAEWEGTSHLICSTVSEGLPCTLWVNQPDTSDIADTLWKDHIHVVIEVADSATDSSMAPIHSIKYKFLMTQ